MQPLFIAVPHPLSHRIPGVIHVFGPVPPLHSPTGFGASHPGRNLFQRKVAHELPPLFGNKLRAVIPDNPGALCRRFFQGYGNCLGYLLGPHRQSQLPADDATIARANDSHQKIRAPIHPQIHQVNMPHIVRLSSLVNLPALTRLGPLPATEPATMNLVMPTYLPYRSP